jgi:hypothetical protein
LGKGKVTFPSRFREGQCDSCCNIAITLIVPDEAVGI